MSEAIPLRNKCMLLSPLRFTACPKDWRQWREIVLGRGCVGRRRHALPPRRRATLRTCSTGGGSEGAKEGGGDTYSFISGALVRPSSDLLPPASCQPACFSGWRHTRSLSFVSLLVLRHKGHSVGIGSKVLQSLLHSMSVK